MATSWLGRTGVRVSAVGLGTMSFGGDADEAEARRMFDACRDAGVNLFDCADVYAKGASEQILGRLVRDCRDEVVITTKAYFPTGPGPNSRGASRYHLVRAVEASLRRLGTDRIDLFFLHRFDDATALDETLRAVEDLVRAGKVLYPAVSNFSAWQTMKAVGIAARQGLQPIVATQPMYNLYKRTAEIEILPMARSEGLAVFPYSPLGGGLLTGKYGPGSRPSRGRIVDNPMYGVRYGADAAHDLAGRFAALAADLGVHPVTLAVAWVAHHPAVTAPLIGGRNLEQLQPSLAAASLELTDEVYAAVSALSSQPPPATDRNEESSAHNYGAR